MSRQIIHSFPVWLPQTQTWLYHQVRNLPSDGTCHIVCKETQNLDQFYLPDIHALTGPSSFFGNISTKIFRHFDYHYYVRWQCLKLKADILHSHFGPVGWKNHLFLRFPTAARLKEMRHVVTFYGMDVDHLPRVDPAWIKRYRSMFRHIDLVLCEGPFMAQKVQALGCPPDKVRVHHLGVDLKTIRCEPRIKNEKEPFKILMAAAFRPKKGLLYGLKALERISSRYDFEITLVGDATADNDSKLEKENIAAFLKASDIGKKVRLTGFLSQESLQKLAYSHHIYLAPSVTAENGDSEGGAPVSLIEMAASGMPVISSRHCDIPEIIQHGKNGFLADERDIDGIENCLTQVMEHTESWRKLTLNARSHIEKNYDAEKQGEKLWKTYEEMINNPLSSNNKEKSKR